MGSPEVSRWWSVLKRKCDYLDKNVRLGLGVNMFNLYVSHFFVDQEKTLGQSENEFEAEWKWIWIPLASSWQLMPDSGMASKVAIWVGLDKVKQLGDNNRQIGRLIWQSKLHHQRMLRTDPVSTPFHIWQQRIWLSGAVVSYFELINNSIFLVARITFRNHQSSLRLEILFFISKQSLFVLIIEG